MDPQERSGSVKKPNRWKGFVLGVIGSNLGLIVMTYYQVQIAPALAGQKTKQQGKDEGGKREREGKKGSLDSISLVGKHYKDEESSTAALGRIIYRQLTGKEPTEEAQQMLSYLVHWSYGMLMGGWYGAARGGVRSPDLVGGLLYSGGLWALGDELAVPLLGLQSGPTAAPLIQHVNRLAAHLLYGAGLSVATQALYFAHDRAIARGEEHRP